MLFIQLVSSLLTAQSTQALDISLEYVQELAYAGELTQRQELKLMSLYDECYFELVAH